MAVDENIRLQITSDASDAQSGINRLINDIRRMRNAYQQSVNHGAGRQITEEVEEAGQAVHDTERRFADASRNITNHSRSIGSVLKGVGRTAVNSGIQITRGFGGPLKLAGKYLFTFRRGLGDTTDGFKHGFWAVLKYAFGIRSLYFLFRKLRQAIKDGFGNLRQYSSETDSALTMLQNSLFTLKNALAVAFNPIVTAIAPLVNQLIQMLITAMNAIGRFFSALTGKKFAVQAINGYNSVAKATTGAGKAAKNAAKDYKKLNDVVLGIDELNINKGDDNSSSGGTGGGGGGAGGDGTNYGEMFDTVKVESKMQKLAKMIRDAWKKGDFTKVGAYVGDAIVKGLNKINWAKIRQTLNKVGKSFATFFNGVFRTEGLGKSIGATLGEALNTGFSFLFSIVDNFDFGALGQTIGSALQSAVQTFDFGNITHWISSKLSGLIELLAGVIEGVDWEKVPGDIWDAIKEAIDGFDWKRLGKAINRLLFAIGGVIETFFLLLSDKLKKIWNKFKEWVAKKALEAWESVKEAWKNANKHFEEKMDGIRETFRKVPEFFKEKFSAGYEKVKEAFRGIKDWFKEKWKDVKGLFTKDKVSKVFKDAFDAGYKAVTDAFSKIGDFFKGIANDIVGPIADAVNGVIDGINWILGKVGSNKTLGHWDPPKFAHGSRNGLQRDTVGMVNDQGGNTYREMIIPPHGEPFIPKGRNVILPMQKGTKIIPANQTAKIPGFAKGVGDILGGAWSKFKEFTGDIVDYLDSPRKIVQMAIDKFTDITGFTGVFGDIASGAISTIMDSVVSYITKIFETASSMKIEKAIKWALGIAASPAHGYDQNSRWGPDYDCSSFVISAMQNGGIPLKSAGATTTHNMEQAGIRVGFKDVVGSVSTGSGKGLRRGDILLNTANHTALYIGDGKVVQASINELGKITGGKPGDQTGREIWSGPYYNYRKGGWDSVLRYAKFANGVGAIPRYNDGGFPENGLFYANDSELVGKFGNRSAVANNYQIEDGIEKAAYNGFVKAYADTKQTDLMEELIRAVKDGKRIVIDGREIVAVVNSRNKRNGYSFT